MTTDDGTPASANAGAPRKDSGDRLVDDLSGILADGQRLPNIPAGLLSEEEEQRRRELCQVAVSYGRRGWRVVPVWWLDENDHCRCKDGPQCQSPAKHPVHQGWQERATCDPDHIAAWWGLPPQSGVAAEWFPRANIGVVTGRETGFFAIDEDTGGAETLRRYEQRHGPLPATRVHSTGGGGTHYFFTYPPGFEIRNSSKRVLGKGLDVRGHNGFVVMPPSRSAKGAYEVAEVHDIAPVAAPAWLLDLLRGYDDGQRGEAHAGPEPVAGTGYARRYAEAALRAESERVRTAEPGRRNATLNEAAFTLGTLGGAGLVTEEAAWQALHEAALACGLVPGEIRPTFLSGWRKGLEKPRVVQWQVLGTDWPVRPWTEFGMADRMADHFGDQLRWCPELASWLVYENGCWHVGDKDTAKWFAQAMIRRLPLTEAEQYDDDAPESANGEQLSSPRDDFLAWVHKQETRKAVTAGAELAMGIPLMRITKNSFDPDPGLLNCMNGAVDLATGQLVPHDPEQRITLQCPVAYDPAAKAPKWQEFLNRVQPDPEMQGFLQRVFGYSATGHTSEQAFLLHHGFGANGKSVCQGVISHVLGTYAQTVPVDTLMASSVDGRIPNDIARMDRKRYLIASETRAGKSLDEQKLKQLTGGDTISARYMRSEFFDLRVIGKIHMATNHMPAVSDAEAIWRRIMVVIWPVTIPEEERDGFLQETLIREEAPGILAWIIAGAIEWRKRGLCPPRSALAAKEEYRQSEDVVLRFVQECLDEVPEERHAVGRSAREIWTSFKNWAHEEGLNSFGQKVLTSRLKKHGYTHVTSNGWNGFPGLQVKSITL